MTHSKTMTVLAILRLNDWNAYHHLRGLSESDKIYQVWALRPQVPTRRLQTLAKVTYIEMSGNWILARLIEIYKKGVELAKRPEVKAIVSFNPVPYGFIALLVGWKTNKPVHIAFVGSDWYGHCSSWYGGVLNWIFKHANLITVMGNTIKQKLMGKGYSGEKICVLEKGTDLDQFRVLPADKRKFDCIFSGSSLEHVKRIDLLLEAIGLVRKKYPNVKLCILGDGPLRRQLENQVLVSGLQKNVTFMGRQEDPVPWFCDSRMVVIASDSEGFPSALMEGICAGAVPVSTCVGAIPDYIEDGKNGLLITPGQPNLLACAILRLLDDKNLYDRIQQNNMLLRQRFSYKNVGCHWTTWLEIMVKKNRVSNDTEKT